jgi:hypothetical protein
MSIEQFEYPPWVSTASGGNRHEALPWSQPSGRLNDPAEILNRVLARAHISVRESIAQAMLRQSRDKSRESFRDPAGKIYDRAPPSRLHSLGPRRGAQKKNINCQTGALTPARIGRCGAHYCATITRRRLTARPIRQSSPNALQILTHVDVRTVLCSVRPHHDMKLWACS